MESLLVGDNVGILISRALSYVSWVPVSLAVSPRSLYSQCCSYLEEPQSFAEYFCAYIWYLVLIANLYESS